MDSQVQLLINEATAALSQVDEILDRHDYGDPAIPDAVIGKMTPLESILGFKVAEEAYNLLGIREQLMVDLLAAGWNQTEIAFLFEISQPSVNSAVRRIRFKLANSRMKMLLEDRVEKRGETPHKTLSSHKRGDVLSHGTDEPQDRY